MAEYELTSPDGQTYRVTAPDNATEAEVMSYFQSNLPSQQQEVQPERIQGVDSGPLNAFVYGQNTSVPFGNVASSSLGALGAKASDIFRDNPLFAGQSVGDLYRQAQADTKATTDENQGAYLAGVGSGILGTLPIGFKGSIGPTPTGGLRGAVNQIPEGLAAIGRFAASGKAAKDASALEKLGSLGLRSIKGGLVAAPAGALYGAGEAESGQRLEGAASGAGLAAGVGAALPVGGAVLGGAAKALVPKVDEGLKSVADLARKYDIPLSFDQITNSKAVKNAQKVSQELPFSGQAGFRDKQISAWQRNLLKTVGIEGDKFTKETMDKAFTEVGKEFDELGKGKTFQFDDQFSRNLDAIREEAKSIANNDAVQNFENEVAKVLGEADGTGAITGEKLGKARARVNELARKTSNPDTQSLLHDLENAIIDTMTAGDDLAKGAFSETKRKYKNLIVLEPLAAKAKGGNISPSLLNSRVSKVYGRSHTRGNAGEIGDLAQIGYELLPELGGSDTTQKLIYAVGAGGGALANAPLTVGALTANRALQSGLNRNQRLIDSALGNLPESMPMITVRPSDALRTFAPSSVNKIEGQMR